MAICNNCSYEPCCAFPRAETRNFCEEYELSQPSSEKVESAPQAVADECQLSRQQ